MSTSRRITRCKMNFLILKTIDGVHVCIKDASLKNAKNDGYWLPLDKLYLIPVKAKK